ncbi:N-acetyltransferase [Cohnella sp. REN36]|uniref:GNAT family N-acetyltransferase n=1 Tax=Cohnella sp. REN36 TaxID=2887347 RepID=UPI001D13E38E|nr:GNAT family N-acetyltransferase [Cohnella sp. REN36]MCC3373586.1 GNAT family N-acetyltransferase [Cohnella sp. REN36]
MEQEKNVQFRSFFNEQDYSALRALIAKKFVNPKKRFYPSLGDLDYIRSFDEEFTRKVTICELIDGTIIGAIWPGHYRILYCVTGPDYVGYEDEILAWAEQQYCAPSLLEDRTATEVYIWAYEEDSVRMEILEARGYTKHTWYMYSGVIDLDSEIPTPQFPKGFRVRPLADSDIEQKVNIMGDSAGLTAPNMDVYQRLMSSPTYNRELDFVVVDEDDQVVGFANVWHDTVNHIALIEPFGTVPSYRRKGLATNLLYECMYLLREKGLSKLYINHGGLWNLHPEPDDAMRVYYKAGFQLLGNMFVWYKSCEC